MTVFSLKTDACLDEYKRYTAEFKDDESDEVIVFYTNPFDDVPTTRRCTRILGVDVETVWTGSDNHSPWDFTA